MTDKSRSRDFLKIVLITIFMTLVISSVSAMADDNAKNFYSGVRLYNEGKYTEAAELFQKVADSGVVNGKLYYNLGNAWFNMNDTGRAMYWYEKAMTLIPNDPDLKFNREYASTFIKDKVEENENPIFEIIFFWKDFLGRNGTVYGALVLNFVFWALVSVRIFSKRRGFKLAAVIVFFPAVILAATVFYDFSEASRTKFGVILPESVSVRSGLSESATELFVLHAGTKVRVDKERDGFVRIRFSRGKIGWMKKDLLGII